MPRTEWNWPFKVSSVRETTDLKTKNITMEETVRINLPFQIESD